MTDIVHLDSAWIAANPAPVHRAGTTKNSRGHVVAIGGARNVPGALRLTGEAALRAGAGKLQIATIASAALLAGMFVPEAGIVPLPEDEDGEIRLDGGAEPLATAIDRCDTVVVGPGIGSPDVAARLVRAIANCLGDDITLVLDAGAVSGAGTIRTLLSPFAGRIVMTPHHGEMATLLDCETEAVAADPSAIACGVAKDYGAIVVLKGSETVIASPDGDLLHYGGGGIGLATAGSGDVLAGAVAGILSRGATPLVAAGWGVWLHGQGGRRVATRYGPIGFLARELSEEFPHLLPQ